MPYKDPERKKENSAKYREKNREKINAKKRLYNEKNKEEIYAKQKVYRDQKQDKDKMKAYQAEWYQINKEQESAKKSKI